MSSSNSTTWSKDQRFLFHVGTPRNVAEICPQSYGNADQLTNSSYFHPGAPVRVNGTSPKSHEIKSLFNLFLLWNDNVMLETLCKSLFSFSRRHAGIAGAWHWDAEKHGHEKGMEAATAWISRHEAFWSTQHFICIYIYIYIHVCVFYLIS